MSKVPKAFETVIAILRDNKDAIVSTIIDSVIAAAVLSSSRDRKSATVRLGADGNPTHILCSYHKMWEPVAEVEFGIKRSSSSGLAAMCKEGTAAWLKQQKVAEKSRASMLEELSAGTLLPTDIKGRQAEIEVTRAIIVPREDGIGESADDKADTEDGAKAEDVKTEAATEDGAKAETPVEDGTPKTEGKKPVSRKPAARKPTT